MAKQRVTSNRAPAPSGAYSQGIRAGDFLFLSGQGPFDPDGLLVNDTFASEVRQVFANLAAVAAESDRSLADAVRVGVYLHDLSTFDEMDAIYRDSFPEPRPARTTIETPLPGFGIEVDAVIYLGD
jgi:2-iminobutanoate/2-iminopropanoate deaminase